MPDDLAEQINWVHEACEAMGVPILTAAGLRGRRRDRDDGDAVRRRPASTWRSSRSTRTSSSWSATGVRVYDPREDGAVVRRRRRRREVRRRAGAGRRRAGAGRATRATTSPACRASARRARSISITQFGSLDALLEQADELKPKQREALTTHREDALRSRELVTIRTDVPLEVDFESLRYRGASRERCYELFSRLAFRSLMNEYAPSADTTATTTTRW